LKKAIGERVIRVQRFTIVLRKVLACNIFSAYLIEEALIRNALKATQVSCATNALEKLIRYMSRQLEVNASSVLVLPFKSLL
jgi:ATP-dependent Lon protease